MPAKNQNPPFVMMPRRLLKIEMTPVAFRVFFVLRSHGNKNGRSIHPGMDLIAVEAQVSRATVARAIVELRRLNIIRWKSGGRSRANEYEILPESTWLNRVSKIDSFEEPLESQKQADRVSNLNGTSLMGEMRTVSPVRHQQDPVNKIQGTRFKNKSEVHKEWPKEMGPREIEERRQMLKRQAREIG